MMMSFPSSQSWTGVGVGVGVALVVILGAVMCVLWCRNIYLEGHRKYWARVRREQLLATGATEHVPSSPRDHYTETDAILQNTD